MVPSISRSAILLGFAISAATMGESSAAFVNTGVPSSATKSGKPLMATTNKYNDNSNSNSNSNRDVASSSARKELLRTLGFTAAGWALSGATIQSVAHAEDDVAAAESSVASMLQSANLRSLKRAEKQLSKMEFYAVDNDFEAIKSALRTAPFSEIRKNSFALIKEYAGEPDQQSKLTASYEVFIASLEKMDSTASLGMRGRKLDNGALLQTYQATTTALNEWIAVASAVAAGSS